VDKDKVYLAGRYFLVLGKEFIVYPNVAQQLRSTNMPVLSKDNQNIDLDVLIQYKLIPSKLMTLYSVRQTSYHSFFVREVEQSVKEVASRWETNPDFYVSRELIAAEMKTAVAAMLDDNYAELVDFQLRGVSLPLTTENKIVETLIAEQEELTESILQQSTVVRSEKNIYATAATAEVTVINSEANALGIAIKATSEAQTFAMITDAKSSMLDLIESGLGLSTPSKLLTYVWYNGFGSGGAAAKTKVVVGIDGVQQAELTT
jgi:regulator of protease activity HflC (stomatin/prohibitin superfamily)